MCCITASISLALRFSTRESGSTTGLAGSQRSCSLRGDSMYVDILGEKGSSCGDLPIERVTDTLTVVLPGSRRLREISKPDQQLSYGPCWRELHQCGSSVPERRERGAQSHRRLLKARTLCRGCLAGKTQSCIRHPGWCQRRTPGEPLQRTVPRHDVAAELHWREPLLG